MSKPATGASVKYPWQADGIPSVFFCRELALLNELPDSNRRYSKNFSRAFGRNEVHQAISILKAVSILVNQSSAHSKKFSHLRLHRFIHLGECEPLLSESFVPTSRPEAFETFAGKFIQPRQHGVWRVRVCAGGRTGSCWSGMSGSKPGRCSWKSLG
jgi:hypothetical protein